MSVSQAARVLRITRSAVIKAARTGRLKGTKVGHTWALLRASVQGYRVAAYRVAAGRAAHRRPAPSPATVAGDLVGSLDGGHPGRSRASKTALTRLVRDRVRRGRSGR